MSLLVLDTSFLAAWHNTRDAHHAAARAVGERLKAGEWGRALLLEYVFVELTTVLAARRSLAAAIVIGDTLLRAREIDFVPSSDLFDAAFTLFRSQGGARLTFTDAAIVAVARHHGARNIATFDQGFSAVEGVTIVPERV